MKTIAGAIVILGLTVCASAQTGHVVQWDPNAATDNVLYYTLTLDTSTGVTVSPAIDPTCNCISWPLPAVANGSHTISLTASNTWGTSMATTVTFNVSAAGAVKNVRIR